MSHPESGAVAAPPGPPGTPSRRRVLEAMALRLVVTARSTPGEDEAFDVVGSAETRPH